MYMKKLVSIILATLMVMSVATAFAADVTYPENLASNEGKTDIKRSYIKCDTAGATVTLDGKRESKFGDASSIIDGVGMVPQKIGDLNDKNGNGWRLMMSVGELPTITIKFSKALTFDGIVYTEARKLITGYTLTLKNKGEVVKTVSGEFDDISTTNILFHRSIVIGETVTADEVVFKVTSTGDLDRNISICEMEFIAGCYESIALENVVSNISTDPRDEIVAEYMMDGTTYQADDTTLGDNARIIIEKNNLPKITVKFAEDITFDTIKHAEVGKMIQKYKVTAYKGGDTVFESGELTFTDGTSTETDTYIRSMRMGERVTADTVEIEVTGLSNTENDISIAELEFWTELSEVTIKDADGAAIPGTAGTDKVANIANGAYDNKPKATADIDDRFRFTVYNADGSVAYKLPYTLEFDLGESKTFNYAELSELRCIFGEINVYTSVNGKTWSLAGTMPKMTYEGNFYNEFVHSVSFDPVTARYVRYVITEIAAYDDIKKGSTARTAHINEVAVCNYTGEGDVTIYPVRIFGENATSLVYDYDKTSSGETTTLTDLQRTVNASVLIKNDTNEAKNYKILAAEYAKSGVLLNVSVKDVTVASNKSRTENLTLSLDQSISNADAQECRVSFMVWDGKTLVPYCQAEVGPYQN